MAVAEEIEDEPVPKKGKMVTIVPIVLGIIAAGLGYFATSSGLIFSAETETKPNQDTSVLQDIPGFAYVEIEPIVVTIRSPGKFSVLRLSTQLEVPPNYQEEVQTLLPRIVDVMNTYLNALEAKYFEDPIAMMKIRAQLLRRIQIVTDQGRVNDLLIMEFVLQ